MNKTFIGIIGGILVVGGLGVYFMGGQSQTPAGTGSLKDLLSSTASQKCVFKHQAGVADSSGEVFVSNGRLRGNFTSALQGKEVQSHMIIENKNAYVWTNLVNQGVKMSVEALSNQENKTGQGVDLNQKLSYSCEPWNDEDTDFFVPPATIQFSDLNGLVQGMISKTEVKTTGGSVQVQTSPLTNQCAACDQVPDATAKAQCKKALNCK